MARGAPGGEGKYLDARELLGAARAERDGLGRTIQAAPAPSWERDSACAGWTNIDVLAHLAGQETAAAQVVAGEPAPELDEYRASAGSFTVDGFNSFAVARRAGTGIRGVISEWGQAADRLLARAARVPGQEWIDRRIPWLGGDIPLRYLVQSRVAEWWLHGEDIRAGAALEPRLRHSPIFLLNDLAIRMLPYAVGLAGLSFPGRSVRIDLEGAGGGSWHYGLAPRDVPGAGKRPDAFVEGRAYPFALVAGRREAAGAYLADGNLVLGGDERLARTILEHIRSSA